MDERGEWDRMVWNGVEMRGGLARGHQHMAFLSEPDMRCPACVAWAEELEPFDGSASPNEEGGPVGS